MTSLDILVMNLNIVNNATILYLLMLMLAADQKQFAWDKYIVIIYF